MTLAFAASYAALCVAQGATVAVPRRAPLADRVARLRSGWWALVPVASIVAVVAVIRVASGVADGLTYLALASTPPLAAAALALRGGRRGRALAALVVPLFALAWAARGTLAGDAASVALTALACAALGVALAAITPPALLKAGIVAMAAADTVLVVVQLLQRPSARLNAAAPALGLPQFQRASFGDAVMGYGDLFLAAVLGGVLALEHREQGRAAAVTTVLALAFGLLFFVVHVLPATVPVAATLIVFEIVGRRRRRRRRRRA